LEEVERLDNWSFRVPEKLAQDLTTICELSDRSTIEEGLVVKFPEIKIEESEVSLRIESVRDRKSEEILRVTFGLRENDDPEGRTTPGIVIDWFNSIPKHQNIRKREKSVVRRARKKEKTLT
jgi:hypothetical protein